MSQIGEKLKRLLSLRQTTQAQLADRSGVSQGILSQLVNGKQQSVSPENLRKLSAALSVPVTYFLTDSVKEYVASRLATRTAAEISDWESMPVHKRVAWVLHDLEHTWGPDYAAAGLAVQSRVSPESIRLMLAGRASVTAHIVRAVSDLTGIPGSELTGDPGGLPASDLPPKFIELAETAYTLGLDPDYVTEMLILLARRPSPTPPAAQCTNEKEPGV